jgi:hypothetical protein
MKGYLNAHYDKLFWQSNKKNHCQLLVFLQVIIFGHIYKPNKKCKYFQNNKKKKLYGFFSHQISN